jgi:hypothetical protein
LEAPGQKEHIDQAVPEVPDVHLIADNYSTNKHVKVGVGLAKRPLSFD